MAAVEPRIWPAHVGQLETLPVSEAVSRPLPHGDWKMYAKDVLCGLYKYSGAMHAHERLQRWQGKSFAAVLLLHRVTDAIPPDGLTVGTRWFRSLCAVLQRSFHVVSLSRLYAMLASGKPLPPRTVAITFDDCYLDNLAAARVLAEHGLPACFFVPTRYVGTDHVFEWDKSLPRLPNLDWDAVREMHRLGHEIGSHTATHADLGHIDAEQARQELLESRGVLEDQLHNPVRWFAYPFGGCCNFRNDFLPLVRETGYDGCFSGYGGFVYPGTQNQVMPREPVPSFQSLLNLELHITGCLDWVYRLKRRAGIIAS